jgi:hypothetical protein
MVYYYGSSLPATLAVKQPKAAAPWWLSLNCGAAIGRIRIIDGYLRIQALYLLAETSYHFGMLLADMRYRLAVYPIRLRMRLCKARIICLKRGYLAPDKGDLASHLRYGRAALNHPVQIVKVFLECSHNKVYVSR